ncbi:hypothetical protein [Nevskia sp.]|uniref:hypothetical protein n=1 Tax=Nevskia sp. TaxID=1929292 RepID=UPI0025D4B5E5|nr:hypothetical protein [Nevskia sp.]
MFALVVLRLGWMSDDAYISFRTVWNLVHGYGLTWNTGERVQAFTHPLWLLVIAAAHAVSSEMYLTAMAVSVVCSLLAVLVVLRSLAIGNTAAVAFVALLLCSQAILDFTTSGLENPLSFLLVALFCALWLQHPSGRRPLFALFLSGCALALNRLDLALLVLPALSIELWQQRSLRTFGLATAALLPLLAWELFSLLFYGFPFPNTYYAKLHTGLAQAEYTAQGFIYLLDVAIRDPGSLLILVLALLSPFVLTGCRGRLPLVLGLALYLAWVVHAGGDFMQGRFVSVPAFLAAVLLTADPEAPNERQTVLLALAVLLIAATRLIALEPPDVPIRANGIADERRFYAAQTGLIHHQRARRVPLNHPWGRIGLGMRNTPSQPVQVFDVIGFAGFVAGPAVHIVDQHALSDAFLARLPSTTPWRIGHFRRELPAGYLDSIASGRNQLADPAQRALYDDLRLVTRGPLLAPGRLDAIWRLNTGGSKASESAPSR